jgi:hypothetical protein
MELLNKTESTVTEVVYTLQDETSAFYYKEWQDERGKVINAAMIDKDGHEIYDSALLEEIEEYLDSIGE